MGRTTPDLAENLLPDKLQDIQDALARSVSLPVLFADTAGRPLAACEDLSLFCRHLTRAVPISRPCLQCGRPEATRRAPAARTAAHRLHLPLNACPLGALDIAFPILSAGRLIAYLLTAQVHASQHPIPGQHPHHLMPPETDELFSLLARLPRRSRIELQSIAESLDIVARLIAALADARRRNLRLAKRLRAQAKLMHEQSLTDAETGLANRRRFRLSLQMEIARARRYRTNLSVAALDIPGLHCIGDEFGHDVCEQVLRAVALSLVSNLRETDLPARVADSHLAVLLPETARHEAMIPLARVKADIDDLNASGEIPVEIRVSIGVADEIAECDEMLRTAFDRARRQRSAAVPFP